MWSSIPASGPPFRYTFKNWTTSHRNPGPDPTGIADHFPPESLDQLHRNPHQVQAHDISHLFHKLRIFGEFEILYPMWLQSERMPDPHDSVLRQTRLGSHQPSAPVRAVFGHRLQRLGYDFFNLMIRDLPWRTYPRLIQQALQSELPKSFPPLPDGRTRNMQLAGDFRVAHFLPTRKHDASTHGHCLS